MRFVENDSPSILSISGGDVDAARTRRLHGAGFSHKPVFDNQSMKAAAVEHLRYMHVFKDNRREISRYALFRQRYNHADHASL